MLLTTFFRIPPDDAIAGGTPAATHPARILFRRWTEPAETRQWSCPVRSSLIEETGILFHEGRDSLLGERRLANLRLILGNLLVEAYRDNADLLELLERTGRASSAEPNDNPLPENDEAALQFLTIHAAKGLEHPIVFLAGNFTDGKKSGLETYRDAEDRLVFDLLATWSKSKTSDPRTRRRKSKQERLKDAAAARVCGDDAGSAQALRAVHESAHCGPARGAAGAGVAGPVPRRHGETASPDDPLPVLGRRRRRSRCKRHCVDRVDDRDAAASVSRAGSDDVFERRMSIQSFTRLQGHRRAEQESFGDLAAFGDERRPTRCSPVDEPLQGAVFGELVHRVFERLDFCRRRLSGDAGRPRRRSGSQDPRRGDPAASSRSSRRGCADRAGFALLCRRSLSARWSGNTLRTPLRPLQAAPLYRIGAEESARESSSFLGSAGRRSGRVASGPARRSGSSPATWISSSAGSADKLWLFGTGRRTCFAGLLAGGDQPGDGGGGLITSSIGSRWSGRSIAGCVVFMANTQAAASRSGSAASSTSSSAA